MGAWALRVRGKAAQATIRGLAPETTVGELAASIASQLGVLPDPDRQQWLTGFPPKRLETGDAAASIASVGITNGDSLTVHEKPAAAPAAAEPAGAAPLANGAGSAAAADDEDAMLAAAIAASLQDSRPQQHGEPLPPAPAPRQQPALAASVSHPPDAVCQTPAGQGAAPTSVPLPDGSAVTRRVIPSDNSCLFTAVGYVMEHDRGRAAALRRVIADAVAADPVTYNEGFLGQTNEEYQAWILNSKHWGGGIELSILCKHYGRQIAAFDIQTKRCDRYGEGEGHTEYVMLIYDGLHYDALAVAAFEGAPEELDVTVLQAGSADAAAAEHGAARLVAACHEARQFTDTANFTLRCGVCSVGIKGEKEAVEHAKATGHSNFQEF